VLMSAAMPSIERVAPHIRIEVLSNDVDSPADELDRASIDFLIMPEQYLVKDHSSERLFEDIYTCIGFTDNPLLPAGDQMSLEEYLALGHVVAQFGTARGVMYDEWLMDRMGLERRVEVVVMNFASIFPAIVGTHRIATTHRRLAQYYAQYLPLRLFDLPLEAPPLVESVKWHRHFDADPGTLWMRRMLRDAAETLDNRFGPTTSP
jgi:LysR family nod box-dependent transcriptional activator